jgi:hypothetical protein
LALDVDFAFLVDEAGFSVLGAARYVGQYKCTSNDHGSMTYFTLFAAAAFFGITVSHLHVGLKNFMLV